MEDIDRRKVYDSRKRLPNARAPEVSDAKKELLILEARLEKATGEDQVRIQEEIKGVTDRLKREGKLPPTA